MNISLPTRVRSPGYLMVLVTGGHAFNEEFPVFDALDRTETLCDFARPSLRMVVLQAGRSGADRLARQWANLNRVRLVWARDRATMVDTHRPDICLAMPGCEGTARIVALCRTREVPVFLYEATDE